MNPDRAVTCPGRRHIGVPHGPTEWDGNGDRGQSDEDGNDPAARFAGSNLARQVARKVVSTCVLRNGVIGFEFGVSHAEGSPCDNEDNGREYDHVNSEPEQRWVPNVPKQAERHSDPAQAKQDHPGDHHQYRDWRDIDAK